MEQPVKVEQWITNVMLGQAEGVKWNADDITKNMAYRGFVVTHNGNVRLKESRQYSVGTIKRRLSEMEKRGEIIKHYDANGCQYSIVYPEHMRIKTINVDPAYKWFTWGVLCWFTAKAFWDLF